MLPRKPPSSVVEFPRPYNVVPIDSAAQGPEPQGPTPVSVRLPKKSNPNHYTRRNALRQFFVLNSGIWKVQRSTGVPTAEIEEDLRKLAYAEWERQQRRAA